MGSPEVSVKTSFIKLLGLIHQRDMISLEKLVPLVGHKLEVDQIKKWDTQLRGIHKNNNSASQHQRRLFISNPRLGCMKRLCANENTPMAKFIHIHYFTIGMGSEDNYSINVSTSTSWFLTLTVRVMDFTSAMSSNTNNLSLLAPGTEYSLGTYLLPSSRTVGLTL
jgi:hypothetical protein